MESCRKLYEFITRTAKFLTVVAVRTANENVIAEIQYFVYDSRSKKVAFVSKLLKPADNPYLFPDKRFPQLTLIKRNYVFF